MATTMQVTGAGGQQFTFASAQTDKGFVLDQSARDEEELRTPGVDGRRWRSKGLQMDEFHVTTVSEAASFSAAITLAKSLRSAKGRNVYLSLDAGNGVIVPYKDIHVKDCVPVPTAGALTGSTVSTNAVAHVVTTWTFVPTTFSTSDNVTT